MWLAQDLTALTGPLILCFGCSCFEKLKIEKLFWEIFKYRKALFPSTDGPELPSSGSNLQVFPFGVDRTQTQPTGTSAEKEKPSRQVLARWGSAPTPGQKKTMINATPAPPSPDVGVGWLIISSTPFEITRTKKTTSEMNPKRKQLFTR